MDLPQWESIGETSWYVGVPASVAIYILLGLALLLLAPSERRVIVRTGLLFLLGLLGVFVGGVLQAANVTWWLYLRGFSILLAGIAVISLGGDLLFRGVLPRFRLTPPRILQDVIVFVCIGIWAMLRLYAAGVDLAGIVTTSAVLTAVLAFALQDTLGNTLGGLALQLDRSVSVGDWVELTGEVGRVVEIGWRQTSVETRDWDTVVYPNSVLVKNAFKVLGRRRDAPVQHRQWVPFRVDYQHDPDTVIQAVDRGLLNARINGVSTSPPPACFLVDIADSTSRYSVCYWLTDLANKNAVDSAVRIHIVSALRRRSIALAYPSQALILSRESERKRAELARDLERRRLAVAGVDLFAALTDEERETVVRRLQHAPFAPGDVVTRQGEEAHWLYIVAAGEADVLVANETGATARVATVGPGDFFGEMGLMLGEKRKATIVAKGPFECYRLNRNGFADLVAARPDLADHISGVLAKRLEALESTLAQIDDEGRNAWRTVAHTDLKHRILRFFGVNGS